MLLLHYLVIMDDRDSSDKDVHEMDRMGFDSCYQATGISLASVSAAQCYAIGKLSVVRSVLGQCLSW